MKRDFTDYVHQIIIDRTSEVGSDGLFTRNSDWGAYSKWMDELDLDKQIQKLNSFHYSVIDKNYSAKNSASNMFEKVNVSADSCLVRLAAIQTDLEAYETVLHTLTETIDPLKGNFDASHISNSVLEQVNSYVEKNRILNIFETEGLDSDSQIEDLNIDTLLKVIGNVIESLPNAKVNGKPVQVKLGSLTITYKVSAEVGKGKTEMDYELEAEKHRVKIKNVSLGTKMGSDQAITGSLSSKDAQIGTADKNVSINIDTEGVVSAGSTFKSGKDTYSYNVKVGGGESSIEMSLKTELENGSVTSTIKISKEKTKEYKPISVIEPEPVTDKLPKIESGKVEYKDVYIDYDSQGIETLSDDQVIAVLGPEYKPSPEKTWSALLWLGAAIAIMLAPEISIGPVSVPFIIYQYAFA